MHIIDTHTHLFAEQFDEDRNKIVKRAIAKGVEKFMLPNIDSTTTNAMNELHAVFPANCLPMMGIHPSSIKENYKDEIAHAHYELYESQNKYWGIGETGLDYYWETTFVKQQKESLRQHTQWAKDLDLPIILHTRDSFEDNCAIMEKAQDGRLRGIFHCFGGTLAEAKRVIDLGFLIGIGGIITFKNSGQQIREVIKEIQLKHIVLETDSPYLAPTPHRGKRNESGYLTLVVDKMAEVLEMETERIAEVTTRNANRIFQFV